MATFTHSPNEVAATWTHSPNEVSATFTQTSGETASTWLGTELMQYGFIFWEGVGDKYEDKPNKNRYSHVHDALQYLFLGAGEGRNVLRGQKPMKPFVMKRNFDVFKKQHSRLKGRSIYD